MNYRIRKSTIERMRLIWWANYSQIARAAYRWSLDQDGVVTSENHGPTTRRNSMPIRLEGLPRLLAASTVDPMLNSFLDTVKVVPERDITANADGTVGCEAPADCVRPMRETLLAIRRKTMAVSP